MLFTIIDIETTGFNRQADDILEVGYIKTNQNCEILTHGSFYFYKPKFKVDSPAQAVHKLTRPFLEEYEADFETNLARLYTMVYNGLMIGKNIAKFDIPFIKSFIMKHADYLPPLDIMGFVDLQDFYTEPFRDWFQKTYNIATKKKGTLSDLIQMLGLEEVNLKREFKALFSDSPRNGVHSALYDVYLTFLLLKDACANRGMNLQLL